MEHKMIQCKGCKRNSISFNNYVDQGGLAGFANSVSQQTAPPVFVHCTVTLSSGSSTPLNCNCRVTDAWNFPLLQPPLVNAGLLPVPLIPWLQLLKTSPRQGPLTLNLPIMHFYHQWVQSICQGPRQDVTVEAHLHRSLNAPKHL